MKFLTRLFNTRKVRREANPRSAGFQTCCIADFQIGRCRKTRTLASLETRDTADLEVCATRLGMKFTG